MANPVEQWFRIADEDRDGGVGGAEAVRFFTKSGLPQDVLGQVGTMYAPRMNILFTTRSMLSRMSFWQLTVADDDQ